MRTAIAEVVSQFKRDWTKCLEPEAIAELCKAEGLSWRERVLSPARTVELMLLQVLHGNTSISHLPHLARMRFCPAAYCRARRRVPRKILEALLAHLQQRLQEEDFNANRWCGHRVFLVDGTGVSMPDEPALKAEFDYPHRQRKECSFPVAHLLPLIHLGTGMVSKVIVSRQATHDIAPVAELHSELQPGDILVGDRAFCS